MKYNRRFAVTIAVLAIASIPVAAWPQETLSKQGVVAKPAIREGQAPDVDRMEEAGTAQLNQQMADFAAQQVAENEASIRRATEGLAEYNAAVAERERIIRQNEAAEIERQRIIRENDARYRAEMAEWERQVGACRAGERSACARD